MYKYIFDPHSNKIIDITSRSGKILIYKYLSILNGGAQSPKGKEKKETKGKEKKETKGKEKKETKEKGIDPEQAAKALAYVKKKTPPIDDTPFFGSFGLTPMEISIILKTANAYSENDNRDRQESSDLKETSSVGADGQESSDLKETSSVGADGQESQLLPQSSQKEEEPTAAESISFTLPVSTETKIVDSRTLHYRTFITDIIELGGFIPENSDNIRPRMLEIADLIENDSETVADIEDYIKEAEFLKIMLDELVAVKVKETHRLIKLSKENQQKLGITSKDYTLIRSGMIQFSGFVSPNYIQAFKQQCDDDLRLKWLFEKKSYFFDKHILNFVIFWSDEFWRSIHLFEITDWEWLGRFKESTLTSEHVKWHKFFFIEMHRLADFELIDLLLELDSKQTRFKTIFQVINKLGEFPDQETKLEDYLNPTFLLNDELKEILLTIFAITFIYKRNIGGKRDESLHAVEFFILNSNVSPKIQLHRLNKFLKMFPIGHLSEAWERVFYNKIEKRIFELRNDETKSEEQAKADAAYDELWKEEEETARAEKTARAKKTARAEDNEKNLLVAQPKTTKKTEEKSVDANKKVAEDAKKSKEQATAEKAKKVLEIEEKFKEILVSCNEIEKQLDILVKNQSLNSLQALIKEMKKLPEDLTFDLFDEYNYALLQVRTKITQFFEEAINEKINQHIGETPEDQRTHLPAEETIDAELKSFDIDQLVKFKEFNHTYLRKKLQEMSILLEKTSEINKEEHESTEIKRLIDELKKKEKSTEQLEIDAFKPAKTQKDTTEFPLTSEPFLEKNLHTLIERIYQKGYPSSNIVILDGGNFLPSEKFVKYRQDYASWSADHLALVGQPTAFYFVIKEESLRFEFKEKKEKTLEAMYTKIYGMVTDVFGFRSRIRIILVVLYVDLYSPGDGVTTNCLNGTGDIVINGHSKKSCELYGSDGNPIGPSSHEACGYDDMMARGMTEWTFREFSVMQEGRKLLTSETIGGLGNWRDTSLAQELFDKYFKGAELDFKVCIYERVISDTPTPVNTALFPSQI